MRISELAQATGLSVPTIKYYLREQLLPPGTKIAGRLAEYDEGHVRRLVLLRLLRDLADVPVERLRNLVRVAEDPSVSVHEMFGLAADALAPAPPPSADREHYQVKADALIEAAGWTDVRPESVDRENLASVIEAIDHHGTHPGGLDAVTPYRDVVDQIARWEIDHLDADKDRLGLLEEMIVGQVVFGQLVQVMRRLAEEHHSKARFGSRER